MASQRGQWNDKEEQSQLAFYGAFVAHWEACLLHDNMFIGTQQNELFISCRTFGLWWMGMLITDKWGLWSIAVYTCRDNNTRWVSRGFATKKQKTKKKKTKTRFIIWVLLLSWLPPVNANGQAKNTFMRGTISSRKRDLWSEEINDSTEGFAAALTS